MENEEMENKKTAEEFRREIQEMGKHFQQEAIRLASLRMHEIVYEPEKKLPSEKRPVKRTRKWSLKKSKRKKTGAGHKKCQGEDAGSLIIDLDPVTNQPIRIFDPNEDDVDKKAG